MHLISERKRRRFDWWTLFLFQCSARKPHGEMSCDTLGEKKNKTTKATERKTFLSGSCWRVLTFWQAFLFWNTKLTHSITVPLNVFWTLVQPSNGIVSVVADLTVSHAAVSSKECPMNSITVSSQPKLPRLQLAYAWSKRMQSIYFSRNEKKKKKKKPPHPKTQPKPHNKTLRYSFCTKKSPLLPTKERAHLCKAFHY